MQEAYEQGTLCAFAVDEAHCVCSWDSFRPAFLQLASLKADFPNVPVTALTVRMAPCGRLPVSSATMNTANCKLQVQ